MNARGKLPPVAALLLSIALAACAWIGHSALAAGAFAENGLPQLGAWTFRRAFFHAAPVALALAFAGIGAFAFLVRRSGSTRRAGSGMAIAAGLIAGALAFVDRVLIPSIDPANLPFFARTPEGFRAFFGRAIETKFQTLLSGHFKPGLLVVLVAAWVVFVGLAWIAQWLVGRLRRDRRLPANADSRAGLYALAGAVFCWIVVASTAALAGSIPPVDAGAARPNVVLISVDTLRADRLGCYGGPSENSPSIDALAARSTLFDNAVAPSSWTLPSHAGMLTGHQPGLLGVTGVRHVVPQSVLTLAELLKADGYRTHGFFTHLFVSGPYGFDQGYDDYTYVESERAADVVDDALAVIDHAKRIGKATFVFLHLFDPHWPYDAPDSARTPVPEDLRATIDPLVATRDFYEYAKGVLAGGEPVADYFRSEYDREVRYVDRQLDRLFNRLDLTNTIVIVTADHGEEFLEHGFVGHSITLYEEVLHVPLIVYAPGRPPARVAGPDVSICSIPATIADLFNVPIPGDVFPSLLASTEPRWLVNETALGGRLRVSVRSPDRMKWIEPFDAEYRDLKVEHDEELYDLAADPREQTNVVESRQNARDRLLIESETFRALIRKAAADDEERELDAETIERLKALGYL